MKLYKLAALLLFFLISFAGKAQFFTPKNYPQNYFIWPVAATKALAANFGELRPNHYHMGLDCKTDKKQDLRVFAAADGYIAKVKIEPYGYGRAIYINHPNGLTTLYAHLNNFIPGLEKYIKEQQYQLKSWAVFLNIPAHLFPVTKGMFIAYSGNTGGSQGPHLHFEIRDTKTDKVLNPSLFGIPIADNVAPDILRLAVYDRCLSTYEQNPQFYWLKKVNGIYVTSPALIVANTDKVSFGISAFDSYNGSNNKNGIYQAVLYENETPITGFQLDSISYDETRYINAHIDYKLRSSGGPFVQHLSKLQGYYNGVYKTTHGNGVITIEDDSAHAIKIEVNDANGNTSLLKFAIRRGPAVAAKQVMDSSAFFKQKIFHPGYINLFENNSISFYLPENALYDSIRFRYNEIPQTEGYTIYQLHNANVPVHVNFPIKIKAVSAVPNKMVMHRFANGNKNDYAKAEYEKGWYKASFREFGNFQLMIDTIAPTIVPLGFRDGMNCSKLNRIAFVIADNTEEIKKFTATLDGNWLRFSNDKGKTFVYVFDELCPPGQHQLKIIAEDQVGNVNEQVYNFMR
jgi:murein DD-endopeptidase MepM/ murein hydrolase activator NlpD